MKKLIQALLGVSALAMATPAVAQTATKRVPLCLQVNQSDPNNKYYVPCTGVVPVDTVSGDALSWADLLGGKNTPAGTASTTATAVQSVDGNKLATDASVTNAVTQLNLVSAKLTALITNLGTPLQEGGNVNVTGGGTGNGGGGGGTGGSVTQSGTWNIGTVGSITSPVAVTGNFYPATQAVSVASLPLATGAATDASLVNAVSKLTSIVTALQGTLTTNATVNGTVGLTGTLPAFASTPTVNVGATVLPAGAASAAKQDALLTAVGSPLQAGGSIGNTAFGATQSGLWSVGLASGTNTIGAVNVNGTIPVTGTFFPAIQPVSQSGAWSFGLAAGTNAIGSITNSAFGISGTLPSFATPPTVNLGTLNGAALDSSLTAIKTALGNPFQVGSSIANTSFGISGTLPAFATTPTVNLGTIGGVATAAQLPTTLGSKLGTASLSVTPASDAVFSVTCVSGCSGGTGGGGDPTSTGVANSTTIPANVSMLGLSDGTNVRRALSDASGRAVVNVNSLPALPTGSNTIGAISNAAFGISGTLPAFASTPTVNLGTLNGAATSAKQDALVSALGSPMQAGGTIGNTSFGAKLQDATGAAFGTSGNPVFVSGGGGGNAVPTGTAGSANAAVVTVQGIAGGVAQAVSGTVNIGTAPTLTVVSAAGNAAIGTVGVTSLPTLPAGTNTIGAVNVNGTVPVSGSVTANLGTLNGAALDTSVQSVTAAINATPAVKQVDGYNTGTINSGTANAAYIIPIANGAGTGGVVVSGIGATGTVLTPEGSFDGTNYVTIPVVMAGTKTLVSTITSDGQYRFNASGRRSFRLRVSTTGTGTITATSTTSVASFDAPTAALDTNGNPTVNIATTSSLSNVIQAAPTDRGAIVGTTAVNLMAANALRRGFSIQNQSTSATCYINGSTTATMDYHSLSIGPGGYFEPDHHVNTGALSIICSAASTSVYAREW